METPLIGKNKNIEKIRELITHVADTGLNVVITGESGVGKEVVAQNLYYQSKRNNKPFVKINCAALPEGLLESELFGYEQGAFTGAQRKKRGKFEIANDGVLFLDEICDMSLPLQSKLLHVLQSGEFSRLGSEKEAKTNAWVIAATNKELEQSVSQGEFREDLYYRLNIIRISVPPLRERAEDIPRLMDYFIGQFGPRLNNKNFSKPDPGIISKLMAYHWPGNTREVQNLLERLVVTADADTISSEQLPLELRIAAPDCLEGGTLEDAKVRLEAELVRRAWAATRTCIGVAKELGISHASATRKLKKYIPGY